MKPGAATKSVCSSWVWPNLEHLSSGYWGSFQYSEEEICKPRYVLSSWKRLGCPICNKNVCFYIILLRCEYVLFIKYVSPLWSSPGVYMVPRHFKKLGFLSSFLHGKNSQDPVLRSVWFPSILYSTLLTIHVLRIALLLFLQQWHLPWDLAS